MEKNEKSSETTPRVPLGGDYWDADPKVPLWGFADLHAHLMAHLAFGGRGFWGLPYDPQNPGVQGMVTALSSCEPVHGGLFNVNPEFGHSPGGGWPEFIVWPLFTTLVHQQAYIDWIYRAYQGGLRLITCLAVNNELLANKSNPSLPTDDKSAIERQVVAMKEMAAYVDAQSGGPGQGWLQVVYSPEQARQVIGDNKLAVVLGVEVDSLGNWRNADDLYQQSGGDLAEARCLIGQELDRLYELGVRQITPIHLTNNAFGGTAIYMRFLETVNLFVAGERWDVQDAWQTGVRYRLDQDGDDAIDDLERTVAVSGRRLRGMHRRTLVDHIPGVRDLYEAVAAPKIKGGHANTRGLNEYGVVLLEELMKRGFIIDVDHMSERATDTTLALVEAHHYPVIVSHTWFRDLLYSGEVEYDSDKQEQYGTSDVHKVAHEAAKRGDQIERIGRLGGIVAPIINQGDLAGLRRCLPELANKVPTPCAGSSTAWAQAYLYAVAKTGGRGVAIGTDINGAAGLPGPRFGVFAAYGTHNDSRRAGDRRAEIERQTNGVAYDTPIRDARWYRFEPSISGTGGYDAQECDIWQAIAQFEAGFNPAVQSHHPTDYPTGNLLRTLKALEVLHLQGFTDNLTEGIWEAQREPDASDEDLAAWPAEKRAAYLALRGMSESGPHHTAEVQELIPKIKAIWDQWQKMKGNNRPLVRSTAGERRDFDYNLDGMAHYGMLPDFLQDLRNIGLTAEEMAPLFRSANDYVEMWTIVNQRRPVSEGRKGYE